MHEGEVTAGANPSGSGSEFRVKLPLLAVQTQAETATAATTTQPTPGGSMNFLVVDDNNDSAESLSMLLQLLGNTTSVAHDGEEALKLALKLKPDVVLLDIGLPKLNGYEVARRIRREPWGSTPILVAITGWGQAEDKDLSHDAGFDYHLVKPVDPDALMKLIEKRKSAHN